MNFNKIALVSGLVVGSIAVSSGFSSAQAATPVASYLFNGNLNAQEAGVTALTPVDPSSLNFFSTDTVFGQTRTVYNFIGGANPPSLQSGLSLNTTGLLTSNNQYSVNTIFEFTPGANNNATGWRRILDVQNRQSDNGFYVNPSSRLAIFPVSGGGIWTNNTFHQVVLTVDSSNNVNTYFDGTFAFTATTTVMNINNPSNLINFFLDNIVGGGQREYSNGKIALVELYNGVLTQSDVTALYSNPFPSTPPTTTPESSNILGLGFITGLGLIGGLKRKSSKK